MVAGIDTDKDLHVAAVVDAGENVLGTQSFSTTRAGYRALIGWLRSFGDVRRVGVKAPVATALGSPATWWRPESRSWKSTGPTAVIGVARVKTMTWMRSVPPELPCTNRRTSTPQSKNGAVESLRVLRVTRATAIRARRNALQLLRMSIVLAPEELRVQVRNLTRMQLICTCAVWRPDTTNAADPVSATRIALKSLARRILELGDEIAMLDELITAWPRSCWPVPASASKSPGSCWSPPGTTNSGYAPKPASPWSAASLHCPLPRG